MGTARHGRHHQGRKHGGQGAEFLFAKAVETDLPQALVGTNLVVSSRLARSAMSVIVPPLVSFPGFTEHCKVTVFCMQLFLVVFCEVLVLPDDPLQQHCPLASSLVVDWEEDLIALGVYERCIDTFPGEIKTLKTRRLIGFFLISLFDTIALDQVLKGRKVSTKSFNLKRCCTQDMIQLSLGYGYSSCFIRLFKRPLVVKFQVIHTILPNLDHAK